MSKSESEFNVLRRFRNAELIIKACGALAIGLAAAISINPINPLKRNVAAKSEPAKDLKVLHFNDNELPQSITFRPKYTNDYMAIIEPKQHAGKHSILANNLAAGFLLEDDHGVVTTQSVIFIKNNPLEFNSVGNFEMYGQEGQTVLYGGSDTSLDYSVYIDVGMRSDKINEVTVQYEPFTPLSA
jgi:hypothetical protein